MMQYRAGEIAAYLEIGRALRHGGCRCKAPLTVTETLMNEIAGRMTQDEFFVAGNPADRARPRTMLPGRLTKSDWVWFAGDVNPLDIASKEQKAMAACADEDVYGTPTDGGYYHSRICKLRHREHLSKMKRDEAERIWGKEPCLHCAAADFGYALA